MTVTVPTAYKAYVYEAYGAVEEQLNIATVPAKPLSLQQVHKPFRFGFDVAGTIVEVGVGVHPRHLKVGDEVYAMTSFTEGSTVAECIEMDQQLVVRKPKMLSFDEAASVPLVAMTSWQAFYEYTQLKSGGNQRVLILGGSSATGMYAIQFAKLAGTHATVTGSTKNDALLKSLGADVVIDYRTQKWVNVVPPLFIDIVYNCGVEANAWNDGAQTVLKEVDESVSLRAVQNPIASEFGAINHDRIVCIPRASDLDKITKLFDEGKLKAVIDLVVPFDKVLEGVARVKSSRAVGKVVVKVLLPRLEVSTFSP